MKRITAILLSILVFSCTSPDSFVLNKYPLNKPILVKKLNGIDKASEISINSFRVFPEAILSLKFIEATEKEIEFELIPENTGSVAFHLLTTEYNYPKNIPVTFEIGDQNYRLILNNNIVAQSDTIKLSPHNKNFLLFQKDGNLLKIRVNCDVISIKQSFSKSTEYLIIQTDNKFQGIIRSLDYRKNY